MIGRVVVLFLAFTLLPAVATAAVARQATPSPEQGALAEGVTADPLVEAALDWHGLPRGLNTLALARLTLPPVVETSAENGAHLFVVESGALTVQEYARAYPPPTGTPGPVHVEVPAGPPVTYRAGDQFLTLYDVASAPTIANEAAEPAVALVVSLAVRSPVSPGEFLTGGEVVESLAVAGAARVGPPLLGAGDFGAEPISVALVRVSYERGATLDIVEAPAARLLVVESGALNVLVADPAFYAPADGAGKPLPPDARISLVPGDQLLVPAPGRVATRNVARGPSAVLIVSVGTAPAATVQQ